MWQIWFNDSNNLSLKTHIKNKHEGVRYPCDLCDYAATTNTALKIHVEAMQASV